MPMSPHQKSIALIMWARTLGFVALAFFALAFVAVLGWSRIVPHQIVTGVAGFGAFFWLSLWILRYLPRPELDAGPETPLASDGDASASSPSPKRPDSAK